jgi:hypothetical protein
MKIAQVLGVDNQILKDKVLNFWISEGCMSEKEAHSRIKEVLAAVLDDDNNVIAVCSGKPYFVEQLKDWFIYYRAYTKPEYRNLDITKFLLNSVQFMNKSEIRKIEGVDVKGVYIVFESEILNKFVKKFVASESKLTLIGWNEKDQQIRVAYFDDAQMK